jgi:hypothetical protein
VTLVLLWGLGVAQIVNVDSSNNAVSIKSQTFKFDRVFDQEAQQEDVFAYIRCDPWFGGNVAWAGSCCPPDFPPPPPSPLTHTLPLSTVRHRCVHACLLTDRCTQCPCWCLVSYI